jgi:hypothetical protein
MKQQVGQGWEIFNQFHQPATPVWPQIPAGEK